MSDSYTNSLRLTQPSVGGDLDTWGNLLNLDMALIESAITGVANINISGVSTYTLSATNGAADEARNLIYNITGQTENCTIIVPNVTAKLFIINNTADAASSLELFVNVAGATGASTLCSNNASTLVLSTGTSCSAVRIGNLTSVSEDLINITGLTTAAATFGQSTLTLFASATVANLALSLPLAPALYALQNYRMTFLFIATVTALTWTDPNGKAIVGAPTSAANGDVWTVYFSSSTQMWVFAKGF